MANLQIVSTNQKPPDSLELDIGAVLGGLSLSKIQIQTWPRLGPYPMVFLLPVNFLSFLHLKK